MSDDRPGHVSKTWTVEVSIEERDGRTRAKARLRWRDKKSVGIGLARRDPGDREVAEIGDELAVARALSDLANRLLAVTAHDIEAVTNESVASLH